MPTIVPATPAQLQFIRKLLAERQGNPQAESVRDALNERRDHGPITKRQASGAITELLTIEATAPAAKAPACTTTVPEGHYATTSRTGANDLDFWRVDRPTEGKWAGRVFVKRVIGGRADSPVRGTEASQALAAIELAGPAAAGQLYGQEVGRCYACNRHLTDATSRQLGIGPDCRAKG
jgi:hypothetical protein